MKVNAVILEQGRYAIIDRGETMKEIAVVSNLNKETMSWGATIGDWCYELYGKQYLPKVEALHNATEVVRIKTESNYIARQRLEEIATKALHKCYELDADEAMELMEEDLDLQEHERDCFGDMEE